MKPIVIILAIACIGLGGALVWRHTTAQTQITVARDSATRAEQKLADTRAKLSEQEKLAAFNQTALDQRVAELTAASNDLAQARAGLAVAQAETKTAQETAVAAQADAQAKGARVAQLEAEKDEMSRKLADLAGQINTLDEQITDTKRKLAESEGDRALLTKQLARLQADKADLMRQFNDLAVIRAQYALLKDEAAVNQRLSWMAQGVYVNAQRKGAESLMIRPGSPVTRPDPSLNVEVDQQGGSKVVPATPEAGSPNK